MYSEMDVMNNRIYEDFIATSRLPKDKIVPIILFIERWEDNLVTKLSQAVAVAYGNSGLYQVRDENSLL